MGAHGGQVGAIGFCMGGALTLLAAEYSGIDAAAPFYGTPPPELGHVSSSICAPALLCSHGQHAIAWSDST
jgi:carboxymethylenebutenolidase